VLALDQCALAGQLGARRQRALDQRRQRRLDPMHRRRLGLAERRVGRAAQQAVEIGARRLDRQYGGTLLDGGVRQLDLRAQHVGLPGLADRVLALGGVREAIEEGAVAFDDLGALAGQPEIGIGACHGGLHGQARRVHVLAGGVGFVSRRLAGDAALPRERQLLRQAEDVVLGRIDAQRLGDVPRLPTERRVVEGRDLRRARVQGVGALAGVGDGRVVAQRDGDDVVESQRFRAGGRGQRERERRRADE
jgi:hypothetical protein